MSFLSYIVTRQGKAPLTVAVPIEYELLANSSRKEMERNFCRDLKMTQGVTFSYQGGNITEYLDFGDYQAPLHYLPKGNTCAELSTVVYEVDGQYDIRVESSEKLYDLEFLAKVSRAIKACV